MRYFIYIIFLTTAVQAFAQQADTLKARVQAVRNGAEAMQQKSGAFQSTLDSTRQHIVLDTLTRALVHMREKTDSIQQGIASLPQRLTDSLEIVQKTTARIEKIETKANEKLTLFNQQGAELPALPDTPSLPAAALPDAPAVPSLPAAKLPEAALPTADLSLPEVGEVVPEEITEAGAISNTIEQTATEASEYTNEIKQIKENGLNDTEKIPALAEQQVLRVDEVGGMHKELAKTESLKKEVIGFGENAKNPDALKEEGRVMIKKEYVNYLAGQEEKVKQGMKSIEKYQRKYRTLFDTRVLPKRRPNPMKDKPFIERLIPGLTIQHSQNRKNWIALDFTPYIGYSIYSKWKVYAGYTYQIDFAKDALQMERYNKQFGYKLFSQLKIWKGFALHVEGEVVKTNGITAANGTHGIQNNTISPHWEKRLHVGVARAYNINKHWKGTSQILYDPFEMDGTINLNKIGFRVGLEYRIKKSKKVPYKNSIKDTTSENKAAAEVLKNKTEESVKTINHKLKLNHD